MGAEFGEVAWDESLIEDCRQLVRLAIREDLGRLYDWTTVALVPEAAQARALVRSRQRGVVAGIPAAQLALAEYDPQLEWQALVSDGDTIEAGATIAAISGSARNLLTAERTALNLLGRLSGIATLTSAFVAAVAGTKARVYDTRKTEPGYRLLDKYAVRAGGGHSYRRGLYDGILIKDNHLAFGATGGNYSPAAAIDRCRQVVASLAPGAHIPIEIEVDSLAQLDEVLPREPDVVLLDNMSLDELSEAVKRRNRVASGVQLEASGGVRLGTIAAIAATGVDRISVGALTHSAPWLDIGLDWS
ncbi:MAG TPA: carboxylating nicotinate-nucleotide diphosphorylase [Pirellulales bacterium]|nr:carboxylating nicotinate-nucleotide diphosphorylase [Pirellulales bacterium]